MKIFIKLTMKKNTRKDTHETRKQPFPSNNKTPKTKVAQCRKKNKGLLRKLSSVAQDQDQKNPKRAALRFRKRFSLADNYSLYQFTRLLILIGLKKI